jgi:hypothetical protein
MDDATAANHEQGQSAPRWYTRVLPVTGLLLAVLAVLALVLPAFRHQVALSTSRESQPFVELFLPQSASEHADVCGARNAAVTFIVRSHLDTARKLAYRVESLVDGKATATKRGTVRLDPGHARRLHVELPAPATGNHTVTVALPALHQLLRVHCSGAAS